jgi:hypothetical protein
LQSKKAHITTTLILSFFFFNCSSVVSPSTEVIDWSHPKQVVTQITTTVEKYDLNQKKEEERTSLPSLLPSYPYLRTALTEEPAEVGIGVLKVLGVGVGVTGSEVATCKGTHWKKNREKIKLFFCFKIALNYQLGRAKLILIPF